MELSSILSIAISGLVMIVITHVAVFWVVRSFYPPAPQIVYYPQNVIAPPQQPVLTQPPKQEQTQAINVPTYETPIQLEAANQEGSTDISTFIPSAPTSGDSGLVAANA